MALPIPGPPDEQLVRRGQPVIEPNVQTHEVAFYDGDERLASVVVDYLGAGLTANQPAVVIATRQHREAFIAGLRSCGFDPDRLAVDGTLLLLDARRTLAAFLDGPTPVWDLFRDTVGNVLDRMRARHPGSVVRAYGEMVDLLCREGNATGAVMLEGFWKRLTREYAFSLLCAYSDGTTLRTANGATFAAICREHDAASDIT